MIETMLPDIVSVSSASILIKSMHAKYGDKYQWLSCRNMQNALSSKKKSNKNIPMATLKSYQAKLFALYTESEETTTE